MTDRIAFHDLIKTKINKSFFQNMGRSEIAEYLGYLFLFSKCFCNTVEFQTSIISKTNNAAINSEIDLIGLDNKTTTFTSVI